ncbi:MAG TPA: sigma-70 family RNA polymerase sigma factor [Planctomycetota bacterium]
MRRAQSGDFDAFEQLVLKYEKDLFALASYIVTSVADAEEVVQETFLNALEHLHDYRGEATFRTWVTRIATNLSLKVLRARKSHGEVSSSGSEDEDSPVAHPEFIAHWRDDPVRLAVNNETREILRTAIKELPEKYRVVFLLRDVEELSVQEAADTLGLTIENVKVRLMRARLMLRERLTRAFGDEATRMTPDHSHDE